MKLCSVHHAQCPRIFVTLMLMHNMHAVAGLFVSLQVVLLLIKLRFFSCGRSS